MGDTLGDKFNFYYLAETMVTDGIFTDVNKNMVVEDIVDQIKTWYIKQIHDKATEMGVTTSTIQGWTDVMDKVDMQTISKNGKPFDLVDAKTFDGALDKYIDNPLPDVEDSNSYMIYLKPSNLNPKEDKRISCMCFK